MVKPLISINDQIYPDSENVLDKIVLVSLSIFSLINRLAKACLLLLLHTDNSDNDSNDDNHNDNYKDSNIDNNSNNDEKKKTKI